MSLQWHRAPTQRIAFFTDLDGHRLFVQQTRRSLTFPGIDPHEYEAFVGGVRVGDYPTLEKAKAGVALAIKARTTPAPVTNNRDRSHPSTLEG